ALPSHLVTIKKCRTCPALFLSATGSFGLRQENLAGIHDAVGVERFLDTLHVGDGVAEFLLEELALAFTDAVLAGAGSVHGDGAAVEAADERLDPCHFFRIVR